MSGPVFVVGASRSGKTLLRWLLCEHSQIMVTRRTQMWPRYYRRFGDLARRENFERCVRAMLIRPQIRALGTDVDRLRRDFARGPATYPRLFALVHEQHAQRCGKRRWGDQTGVLEQFAEELVSSYDDVRIVHVIRDPRDRFAALVQRDGRRRLGLGTSTRDWVTSASLAVDNSHRHPGSYKIVRYEDLVSEPEATMRDTCAFLGEEYEPAILRLEHADRYQGTGAGTPISTEFVGQHRGTIDRAALAHIQSVAGLHMQVFGYPLLPLRLSTRDRVRVAAEHLPARLVRRRRAPARPREALTRASRRPEVPT